MNSPASKKDIHTNLPSLDDIKDGKIKNIKFVKGIQGKTLDSLAVRVKIKGEKERQTYFKLNDYIDEVLCETQLILDASRKKGSDLEYREKMTNIVNQDGRIDGLAVKIKRNKIVFTIILNNGTNKIDTTRCIDLEDFDSSYYNLVNFYISVREKLGFKSISNRDVVQLSSSIEYYRTIFQDKLRKNQFKNDKQKLINEGHISDQGKILSIKNNGNFISYKSSINQNTKTKVIGAKSESEIIDQFITTFIIQHGYEMGGDLHKYLKSKSHLYTSYFIKKDVDNKQKNSNVG